MGYLRNARPLECMPKCSLSVLFVLFFIIGGTEKVVPVTYAPEGSLGSECPSCDAQSPASSRAICVVIGFRKPRRKCRGLRAIVLLALSDTAVP